METNRSVSVGTQHSGAAMDVYIYNENAPQPSLCVCIQDLDEAMPAYYASIKALDSLDKKSIQEMKSFSNPPQERTIRLHSSTIENDLLCLYPGFISRFGTLTVCVYLVLHVHHNDYNCMRNRVALLPYARNAVLVGLCSRTTLSSYHSGPSLIKPCTI